MGKGGYFHAGRAKRESWGMKVAQNAVEGGSEWLLVEKYTDLHS